MTPQRPTDVRTIRLKTLCLENAAKAANVHFLNVLHPKKVGTDSVVVNAIEAEGLVGAEIIKGHIREVVLFSEGGQISWNGIQSDASMLSVVYEDGEVMKLYKSTGSYLTLNGVTADL